MNRALSSPPVLSLIFFFMQKTAYEMRISDWSSDVCSSDLPARLALGQRHGQRALDRVCDFLGAIGVDQHHVSQLQGGASEAGEDENARVLGVLRGHIFLGPQVHAVPERGHPPAPSRATAAGKLLPVKAQLGRTSGRVKGG